MHSMLYSIREKNYTAVINTILCNYKSMSVSRCCISHATRCFLICYSFSFIVHSLGLSPD